MYTNECFANVEVTLKERCWTDLVYRGAMVYLHIECIRLRHLPLECLKISIICQGIAAEQFVPVGLGKREYHCVRLHYHKSGMTYTVPCLDIVA